ncbi:MAG TPA: HAD family phosphatase [Pseudonocardiaceae bacterium]|nr:HAD family phosphatase [Pseudonocardiaceae bacterium]
MIEAVVFDLDGVLVDSEPVWEQVRRGVVADFGGQWQADTQRRLMGMSTREWAAYLSGELGVRLRPDDVAAVVIDRMAQRYSVDLPLLPGAVDAVRRLADSWPLGLASSSPPLLIETVLTTSLLKPLFTAAVSADSVAHGKPAPDVYRTAAEELGVPAEHCAAVEDSSNGLRSAAAAGMRVIAVPRDEYPPDEDALESAAVVLTSLMELTPETVEAAPR